MFVISNTIIDLKMTLLEEAKLIFRLVTTNESIIFCLHESDAKNIEDTEIRHLLENRIIYESNFDFINNEEDRTNTWVWLKLNTIQELARILELDFYLYYCLVLNDGNDIKNYKYLVIKNDSYTYKNKSYRAMTLRTKNNDNLTDLLRELVCNSGRSDIG